MISFETGPVRPPSEATSLLLRLTRSCHWNKCDFCPVYKRYPFSARKVDEVLRDVDAMAEVAGRFRHYVGTARLDRGAIAGALQRLDRDGDVHHECARQMAFWIWQGLESLFLQDADALVLRTASLVEVLEHVLAAFPTLRRVTSYSRSKTLGRKSADDLKALRAAGLNRVHTGMESGSDVVLAMMHKGVTREEQIRSGRNVVAAGIELSEYFMPGLGGQALSEEHAAESAAVLSAINPTFIRIRSTVPIPGTPLHDMMTEGRWSPLGEEERVRELRVFLAGLDGVTSTVQSDHIMNLLEDVAGQLPGDRERMLDTIDRFLGMPPADKESFIVGRRIGRYRSLADYVPSADVESVRLELIRRFGTLERGLLEIMTSFV